VSILSTCHRSELTIQNRSPRSPLQESRQANRNAYPSPVSNSPTWRFTGALPTPPSFTDADYQRIHRETLAERSTASSSLEALEKAVHHVDNMSPGLALYSPRSQGSILDDFASIAAKSERSPPLGGNRVLEPIEDDLPTADETSQQAAAILLSVAENTAPLAPRRTQRTPRPTGKAFSSPFKVSRSEGKKAKTAATPLAKVQDDPAPKKVRQPSFRLKDPVEGAVDGVGMAPQGITYKGMIYKVMKEHGGPVRLHQVWEAWKRMWPFYANMTNPKHIKSLENSIRHTLSLEP